MEPLEEVRERVYVNSGGKTRYEIGVFECRNGVIVPNTPETVCEIAELIEVDNGDNGRS